MPKIDAFVSVVLPIHNGASFAVSAVKEISHQLAGVYANYELIIVDNGSSDETVLQLRPLLETLSCIRILRLSRRYDRETALFAGLENAIGDFVVTLQIGIDPPERIPVFIERLRSGKDIVYGISSKPLRLSLFQQLAKRFLYWYLRVFVHLAIPFRATSFVSLNRRAVNALTRNHGRFRHLRALTKEIGFASAEIGYALEPGASERARQGLLISLREGVSMIMSHSTHPLRFMSRLGLVVAVLNAAYGIYAVAVHFLVKSVIPGWTTLSVEVAVMFFFLFSILAVMAEYLGRVLEETRRQPSYHLMEELISDVALADSARLNIARVSV